MLAVIVFVAAATTTVLGALPETCLVGVDKNIVENKIVYLCQATSGQPAYLPIACQVPNGNPSIFYPNVNGGVGNDGVFKYRCFSTGATSMELDITGCLAPNGGDIPVNQPYETTYNGVITCSQDATGKVTRTVQNVCVRPNHAYYKSGETWAEANGKFKCTFKNGEYHVEANGCVSGSVIADLDKYGKIGDKFYKCVKDATDETKATFQVIEPSTCGDHALESVYAIGDVGYKCIEQNMTAFQVEYGCFGFGKVLMYGAYQKFSNGDVYLCDKGTHLMRNITALTCPGGQRVFDQWIENGVVFTCYFSSGSNTFVQATDCIAEDGKTKVPKGKTMQVPDGKGGKYGLQCIDKGNNVLENHKLTASEYAKFLKDNGMTDGESQTGDGGEGQGKFVSTTRAPPPPPAVVTTRAPPPPPPAVVSTRAPPPPPPATSRAPPPPPPRTSRAPPPPPVPETKSPAEPETPPPEPECEDTHDLCPVVAHLCMDDEDFVSKGSKASKAGGRSSSSSGSSEQKSKKGRHRRSWNWGTNNQKNNNNKNKGKKDEDCDSNEQKTQKQQSKGSGKPSAKSSGSSSASKEKPEKSNGCCKDVDRIKESIKTVLRTLCPKTCNACNRPHPPPKTAPPPPVTTGRPQGGRIGGFGGWLFG